MIEEPFRHRRDHRCFHLSFSRRSYKAQQLEGASPRLGLLAVLSVSLVSISFLPSMKALWAASVPPAQVVDAGEGWRAGTYEARVKTPERVLAQTFVPGFEGLVIPRVSIVVVRPSNSIDFHHHERKILAINRARSSQELESKERFKVFAADAWKQIAQKMNEI